MTKLLTALCILATSICLAAPQRDANLLSNARFEEIDGAVVSDWNPVGHGYDVLREGAQDGSACFSCESDENDQTYGAMQEITFDPPIQHPFKVTGWSKSVDAVGAGPLAAQAVVAAARQPSSRPRHRVARGR